MSTLQCYAESACVRVVGHTAFLMLCTCLSQCTPRQSLVAMMSFRRALAALQHSLQHSWHPSERLVKGLADMQRAIMPRAVYPSTHGSQAATAALQGTGTTGASSPQSMWQPSNA